MICRAPKYTEEQPQLTVIAVKMAYHKYKPPAYMELHIKHFKTNFMVLCPSE